MKFEFIEYKLDENGNEVVLTSYEVDALQFYRTMESLDKDVQDGRISSYAYTPV